MPVRMEDARLPTYRTTNTNIFQEGYPNCSGLPALIFLSCRNLPPREHDPTKTRGSLSRSLAGVAPVAQSAIQGRPAHLVQPPVSPISLLYPGSGYVSSDVSDPRIHENPYFIRAPGPFKKMYPMYPTFFCRHACGAVRAIPPLLPHTPTSPHKVGYIGYIGETVGMTGFQRFRFWIRILESRIQAEGWAGILRAFGCNLGKIRERI